MYPILGTIPDTRAKTREWWTQQLPKVFRILLKSRQEKIGGCSCIDEQEHRMAIDALHDRAGFNQVRPRTIKMVTHASIMRPHHHTNDITIRANAETSGRFSERPEFAKPGDLFEAVEIGTTIQAHANQKDLSVPLTKPGIRARR